MSTATDIMTQLEELWESAEPGPFGEGDTVIVRHVGGGDYNVRAEAGYSSESDHIRTIQRAKPKAPEWEAVVASHLHSESHKREVYFRNGYGGWESETWVAEDDELVDPVPLVEVPSHDELARALLKVEMGHDLDWPGSDNLADAVLELLKGH